MTTLPTPPATEPVKTEKDAAFVDRLRHAVAGADESAGRAWAPASDEAVIAALGRAFNTACERAERRSR